MRVVRNVKMSVRETGLFEGNVRIEIIPRVKSINGKYCFFL